MNTVALFFTGGTIVMRPKADAGGVAPCGDFERLAAEVEPHLPPVKLRPVAWGDRPSPHMTPELMFRLAKDIEAALADPAVAGAVVLHGTDVLVESAFLADLVIHSDKPVVYTGSMRYYMESGYDGLRNLENGVKACLSPLPQDLGVVLLMTDRFFAAREVAKINSLNIDAFASPEAGPVALVAGDAIRLTRSGYGPRTRFRLDSLETGVELITCFTGMDGSLLDNARERGVSGLVLEAFGAGNVPPGIVPAVERLLAAGIPVVLSTRCIEGGAWPVYGYLGGAADLQQRGVILSGRLSGPKARLLLMAALSQSRDRSAIQQLFETFMM